MSRADASMVICSEFEKLRADVRRETQRPYPATKGEREKSEMAGCGAVSVQAHSRLRRATEEPSGDSTK